MSTMETENSIHRRRKPVTYGRSSRLGAGDVERNRTSRKNFADSVTSKKEHFKRPVTNSRSQKSSTELSDKGKQTFSSHSVPEDGTSDSHLDEYEIYSSDSSSMVRDRPNRRIQSTMATKSATTLKGRDRGEKRSPTRSIQQSSKKFKLDRPRDGREYGSELPQPRKEKEISKVEMKGGIIRENSKITAKHIKRSSAEKHTADGGVYGHLKSSKLRQHSNPTYDERLESINPSVSMDHSATPLMQSQNAVDYLPRKAPSGGTDTSETTASVGMMRTASQVNLNAQTSDRDSESDHMASLISVTPLTSTPKKLIHTLASQHLSSDDESSSDAAEKEDSSSTSYRADGDPATREFGEETRNGLSRLADPHTEREHISSEVAEINGGSKNFEHGSQVTYGAYRSYLQDYGVHANSQDFTAETFSQPTFSAQNSGLSLLSHHRANDPSSTSHRGTGLSDDEDVSEQNSRSIKSVHELRAAGESRRVIDETNGLLEDLRDLAPSAKSIRRNAIAELVAKMLDSVFLARFNAQSFGQKYLHYCAEDLNSDNYFAFLAIIGAALIIESDASSTTLEAVTDSSFIALVIGLLKLETNMFELCKGKELGVPQSTQSRLKKLQNQLRSRQKFSQWALEAFSLSSMALQCLETSVRKFQTSKDIDCLVDADSVTYLLGLTSRGADMGDVAQSERSELALSILETTSLNARSHSLWDAEKIQLLANLMTASLSSHHTELKTFERTAWRLAINLTNDQIEIVEWLTESFEIGGLLQSISGRFSTLRPQAKDGAEIMDLLLLLGTGINLTEFCGKPRSFELLGRKSTVDKIADTFIAGLDRSIQSDSHESSNLSVLYGYLAVLLGNFCQDERIRHQIRSRLPNKNFEVLISAEENFIECQSQVDQVIDPEYGGNDPEKRYIKRLRALVQRLKEWENEEALR